MKYNVLLSDICLSFGLEEIVNVEVQHVQKRMKEFTKLPVEHSEENINVFHTV